MHSVRRGACDLRQVSFCELIHTMREGVIWSGHWAPAQVVLRAMADFMQTMGVTSGGHWGLVCWELSLVLAQPKPASAGLPGPSKWPFLD